MLAFCGTLLALLACSNGNREAAGVGLPPGTVQVVIDTASPGDGMVQFQIAAARLQRSDGTLTGNVLRETAVVTWTDPSGEIATLSLSGVPGGVYQALQLLVVPGSGIALALDGQLRPIATAVDLEIPISDGLVHAAQGISWLAVGHNSGPTVVAGPSGLVWLPALTGRSEGSVHELTGLQFLLRQGSIATCTLPAAADGVMQLEFAANCVYRDDEGGSYGSRDAFLASLVRDDDLLIRGALNRNGRAEVRYVRRGRGNDGPRLIGRVIELQPSTISFRMRVQAEVRRGTRTLLTTPAEVIVRAANARLQRPNSQVQLTFDDLVVGSLVKVKWSVRGTEDGVPFYVAREIEVTPGNGVPMQPEWQGRVQSVDLVARRIVVVPRNNDPILVNGSPVPQVEVVVGPDTPLQRRQRQGGGRFPIQLNQVVPGEDRIWWGGIVTGPAAIEASWVRVRED